MKNTYRHILKSTLAALTVAVGLMACNDDDNMPASQLCETIVTFTGNNNGYANFEYRELDDSPLIYLNIPGAVDEKSVPTGTRLLLRYRLAPGIDPTTSNNDISVVSLQRILCDTVKPITDAPARLGEIYLNTLHRSGEYLDMQCQMPQTAGQKVEITALSAPDENGIIDLYINAITSDDSNTYSSTTWASMWIGPVWREQNVSGLRVHINNSNNIYRNIFTFTKTTT